MPPPKHIVSEIIISETSPETTFQITRPSGRFFRVRVKDPQKKIVVITNEEYECKQDIIQAGKFFTFWYNEKSKRVEYISKITDVTYLVEILKKKKKA